MGQASRTDVWINPASRDGKVDDDQDLRQAARCMIVARRALSEAIPIGLIHDPSLDMMLALFMAPAFRLPRTALPAATTVTTNVAQRWIDVAIGTGLMSATADVSPKICLTPAGVATMRSALQAVIESQRALDVPDLH